MSSEQTAPWAAEAENLIRGALAHVFTVSVYTYPYNSPQADPLARPIGEVLPVVVTACTVTMDEFWSPFVQGELTAEIPDEATLNKLDPRTLVRIDVSAGYVLPGGVKDVHPLAYCYLSERSVDYPANEMRLQFQGFEYLFDRDVAGTPDESPANTSGAPWTSTTPVGYAMDDVAGAVGIDISGSDIRVTDEIYFVAGWVDPGEPWFPQAGDNALSMAREVADRVDGWFRADELGVFRMSYRSWTIATPVHSLRVGADGTILGSSDRANRDDWANRAYVQYDWSVLTTTGGTSTAVQKTASGAARLTGTPFDSGKVGTVTVSATRNWPATNGQAARAAAALLRRHTVRSTSLQLSAVAAYWVRPPRGVTVELPIGGQRNLAVSAITFDLVTGRMDIRTRNLEPGAIEAL